MKKIYLENLPISEIGVRPERTKQKRDRRRKKKHLCNQFSSITCDRVTQRKTSDERTLETDEIESDRIY